MYGSSQSSRAPVFDGCVWVEEEVGGGGEREEGAGSRREEGYNTHVQESLLLCVPRRLVCYTQTCCTSRSHRRVSVRRCCAV